MKIYVSAGNRASDTSFSDRAQSLDRFTTGTDVLMRIKSLAEKSTRCNLMYQIDYG